MHANVFFVNLFVQRSEFNLCLRMALYEIYLLLVVVLLQYITTCLLFQEEEEEELEGRPSEESSSSESDEDDSEEPPAKAKGSRQPEKRKAPDPGRKPKFFEMKDGENFRANWKKKHLK